LTRNPSCFFAVNLTHSAICSSPLENGQIGAMKILRDLPEANLGRRADIARRSSSAVIASMTA
jgi:hypothetical protein